MPTLVETQRRMRDAVVTRDAAGIAATLPGGLEAARRFAIHRRNYETSLVTALLTKFPATVWLVGSRFVAEAAAQFIHEQPPKTPCISEYGDRFPQFLSALPGSERVPYLRDFATLEWQLVQASIAIDSPFLNAEDLWARAGGRLFDSVLTLQGGLRLVRVSWPVDELMELYLAEAAPDHFEMSPCDLTIQVDGARGEFRVGRLDRADFEFRELIVKRRSIGDAAERALDVDADFDPGHALGRLAAEKLITGIERDDGGDDNDYQ